MTPLGEIIRARIAADGPMPLADYMALCLGHPEHGYYFARPAIGAAGDFTTAPEISQMFGEIVAAWLAHAWELAGRPDPVRIVELGPGRGTLMADILRTFRLLPDLVSAARVHLVETSPAMRAAQRAALAEAPNEPAWHASLAEVPGGPALLVANEFFDALPIRQFIRRGSEWRERHVGLAGDRLVYCDGPPAAADEIPPPLRDLPGGTTVETCPLAAAIAAEIGARLTASSGAALIIDYGYRSPAAGDSLQALRGKRPADPLEAPGEADLTAHVDFSALSSAATRAGAACYGPVTQASFLTALGIGARAERLRAGGAPAEDLTLALERLTGAGGMGTLFKTLAVTAPDLPVPPPFDSIGG
jgi:NADH dehydrogenase [ubiquinone] 1 alpha subcomplex assembly factor 7